MDVGDSGKEHVRSHLFTLRLWDEEVGPGQVEWRAKLKRVADGETRYLRQWDSLLDILLAMIGDTKSEDDGLTRQPTTDDSSLGSSAYGRGVRRKGKKGATK